VAIHAGPLDLWIQISKLTIHLAKQRSRILTLAIQVPNLQIRAPSAERLTIHLISENPPVKLVCWRDLPDDAARCDECSGGAEGLSGAVGNTNAGLRRLALLRRVPALTRRRID